MPFLATARRSTIARLARSEQWITPTSHCRNEKSQPNHEDDISVTENNNNNAISKQLIYTNSTGIWIAGCRTISKTAALSSKIKQIWCTCSEAFTEKQNGQNDQRAASSPRASHGATTLNSSPFFSLSVSLSLKPNSRRLDGELWESQLSSKVCFWDRAMVARWNHFLLRQGVYICTERTSSNCPVPSNGKEWERHVIGNDVDQWDIVNWSREPMGSRSSLGWSWPSIIERRERNAVVKVSSGDPLSKK